MEVIVQNLAVTADAGVLANRDLLPGVNRCSTYPYVIADFNLRSRSARDNDRPAVKTNQVTEKATLDCDILTNLQLGTTFVENDRHTFQQEVFSIFNFRHFHN